MTYIRAHNDCKRNGKNIRTMSSFYSCLFFTFKLHIQMFGRNVGSICGEETVWAAAASNMNKNRLSPLACIVRKYISFPLSKPNWNSYHSPFHSIDVTWVDSTALGSTGSFSDAFSLRTHICISYDQYIRYSNCHMKWIRYYTNIFIE